jgi:hypothetical protein
VNSEADLAVIKELKLENDVSACPEVAADAAVIVDPKDVDVIADAIFRVCSAIRRCAVI